MCVTAVDNVGTNDLDGDLVCVQSALQDAVAPFPDPVTETDRLPTEYVPIRLRVSNVVVDCVVLGGKQDPTPP